MRAPYLIARNFIERDEAKFLCDYIAANKHLMRVNGNHLFDGRNIEPSHIDNREVYELVAKTCRRVRNTLRAFYNEPSIHLETTYLNHWPVGMDLGLHADNTYYPEMTPNYVWWRTYSAVVYLNGDYTGGEFYFLDGEVIRPTTGDAVMFGAGPEYVHGVRKVLSGERYTIPIWCSKDSSHTHEQMLTDSFTRDTV